MIEIGTRVRYAEENVSLDDDDDEGTVVRPTEEEVSERMTWEYPPTADEVLVEWDDGERYWEFSGDLVVIERADR